MAGYNNNRRFPPKLKDTLRANKSAFALLDGGRNLEITATLTAQADAMIGPQRKRSLDIDKAHGKHPRLERAVNDEIRKLKFDGELWRNSRGMIHMGNGRYMPYGLGPDGASDWIGYRSIVITAAMVGKRVAQFIAVEAKRRPSEKPRPNQVAFIDSVVAAGGVAGVAHSGDEALEIINRAANDD